MNYQEAISQLTSPKMFYSDLGLDRISQILSILNNPQDKLKCIHVAGTNGKGSVCAFLNSILIEAGYKVGMYTSPHIFEYTERIKINNINIPEQIFADLFEKINNTCENNDIYLTEFEMLTVIMFLYFERNNVEYVILETGMGGRLDATNVLKENLCSIITNIDLDHTDQLGDTREKIAYEKAGIIKANCPIVTSMGYEVIRDRADELNSMLLFTSPYVPQEFVEISNLKGLHQIENLALALTCINHLFKNITPEVIKRALVKVKNPYRFEYFKDKNLIVDVAHNPNGIDALRKNLDFYYPNQNRRYIYGCLETKDYKKMMNILFREGDEAYLNHFNYPKSCTYDELVSTCPISAKQYTPEIILSPDKLNIICGSFYMLKGLKKYLL